MHLRKLGGTSSPRSTTQSGDCRAKPRPLANLRSPLKDFPSDCAVQPFLKYFLACQRREPALAPGRSLRVLVFPCQANRAKAVSICNRYLDVSQTAPLAPFRESLCEVVRGERGRLCPRDNCAASFVILDSLNKAVAPFSAFHGDGWRRSCPNYLHLASAGIQ